MLCILAIYSQSFIHFDNTKGQFLAEVSSSSRFVCATPLCSPFETPGRLAIMTETPLRKRVRDPESLPDSIDVQEPKRLHGEETDGLLELFELDQTLVNDDEEEEFAPSEELVNEVMRSLEEEIAVTCSTSFNSSDSGDNSATSDSYVGQEGETVDSESGFDLCYLLEASDHDLGIPPSTVLDLKDEICLSTKEASECLFESADLKSLAENWHFEDDFENYEQFVVYEDPWDDSQLLHVFDGDFSAATRLETDGGRL